MKVCSLGRAARSQANVQGASAAGTSLNQSEFGTGKDGLIRIMPQILEELNVKTLAFAEKQKNLICRNYVSAWRG